MIRPQLKSHTSDITASILCKGTFSREQAVSPLTLLAMVIDYAARALLSPYRIHALSQSVQFPQTRSEWFCSVIDLLPELVDSCVPSLMTPHSSCGCRQDGLLPLAVLPLIGGAKRLGKLPITKCRRAQATALEWLLRCQKSRIALLSHSTSPSAGVE